MKDKQSFDESTTWFPDLKLLCVESTDPIRWQNIYNPVISLEEDNMMAI
jgi:hypothetical protein